MVRWGNDFARISKYVGHGLLLSSACVRVILDAIYILMAGYLCNHARWDARVQQVCYACFSDGVICELSFQISIGRNVL